MTQVDNKNIDNASGQVVRLDIQNTLKAVTTNNFGPRMMQVQYYLVNFWLIALLINY